MIPNFRWLYSNLVLYRKNHHQSSQSCKIMEPVDGECGLKLEKRKEEDEKRAYNYGNECGVS